MPNKPLVDKCLEDLEDSTRRLSNDEGRMVIKKGNQEDIELRFKDRGACPLDFSLASFLDLLWDSVPVPLSLPHIQDDARALDASDVAVGSLGGFDHRTEADGFLFFCF
jgi:hypothetical protein